MSSMNTTSSFRVNHAQGATVDVHRSGPYPAPYVFDVTWPDGRTETITPDSNVSPDRQATEAYARNAAVVASIEARQAPALDPKLSAAITAARKAEEDWQTSYNALMTATANVATAWAAFCSSDPNAAAYLQNHTIYEAARDALAAQAIDYTACQTLRDLTRAELTAVVQAA